MTDLTYYPSAPSTVAAAMRLVFFDAIPWQYDPETPLVRPLGGSQSALCYLTAALARAGHEVTLANHVEQRRTVLGVDCIPRTKVPESRLLEADAFIVLNGNSNLAPAIRGRIGPDVLLVLWTQHAVDQPAMQALESAEVRDAWDRIVCISDWHRQTVVERFNVDPRKTEVLRNAIGPAFEALFASAEELAAAKPDPLLVYTSTPFRGLDALLVSFPAIRRRHPQAELEVYSSMKVYQDEGGDGRFGPLYELCRRTPGARYFGSMGQKDLAARLRAAAVFAYPNTFAETSCIAAMEAMAAGAYAVTSDLGALPETTLGRATLVPPLLADEPVERFLDAFAAEVARTLERRQADPAGFAAECFEQVKQLNAECTWAVRAAQWAKTIAGWRG